jgi:hypothetical protein
MSAKDLRFLRRQIRRQTQSFISELDGQRSRDPGCPGPKVPPQAIDEHASDLGKRKRQRGVEWQV